MALVQDITSQLVGLAMEGLAVHKIRFARERFNTLAPVREWSDSTGVDFLGLAETSQHIEGICRKADQFDATTFDLRAVDGYPGVILVVGKPVSDAVSKESSVPKTAGAFLFKTAGLLAEQTDTTTDADSTEGVYIAGLLSVNTEDRDGDVIEPDEFDLEAFKANPQLFVNHKPWLDESGNETSIGTVIDAFKVKISPSEDDNSTLAVIRESDSSVISYLEKTKFPDLVKGARGVWVICHVTEPKVCAKVNAGELNTFSWSGTRYEDEKYIDIYEVSLVLIPANRNAVGIASKRGKDHSAPNISGNGEAFFVRKALATNLVVSVLYLSKGRFRNVKAAVKWALANGFSATEDSVVEEEEFFVLEQRDRGDFIKDTLKKVTIDSGVQALVGETKTSTQKGRGDGIGVGGSPQQDGGTDQCVCPECGVTVDHERGLPCNKVKCPECGSTMMGMDQTKAVEQSQFRGRAGVPKGELPDAAFAYIAPGGTKEDGITRPLSLRYWPHHTDAVVSGTEHTTIDIGRLRATQSSYGQRTKFPSESARRSAEAHVRKHLKALGIGSKEEDSDDFVTVKIPMKEAFQTFRESLKEMITNKFHELLGSGDNHTEGGERRVDDLEKDQDMDVKEETTEKDADTQGEDVLTRILSAVTELAGSVEATSARLSELEKMFAGLDRSENDEETKSEAAEEEKSENTEESTVPKEVLDKLDAQVEAIEKFTKAVQRIPGASKQLGASDTSSGTDAIWDGLPIG